MFFCWCRVLHGMLTVLCWNALQIPIVRGVPRKDAKEFGGLSAFTSNAELINVRLHCCAWWFLHLSAFASHELC
jgi:hypothetical protein